MILKQCMQHLQLRDLFYTKDNCQDFDDHQKNKKKQNSV